MPRHWLCIITPENYKIMVEKRIWGVKDRHRKRLYEAKPGDKLVMYLKGEKKIMGVFEVVSNPFYDESKVFLGDIFPHRVRVKPVLLSERGVEIKRLLDKLEIFRGKKKWVGVIQGKAMVPISENDYAIVVKALQEMM